MAFGCGFEPRKGISFAKWAYTLAITDAASPVDRRVSIEITGFEAKRCIPMLTLKMALSLLVLSVACSYPLLGQQKKPEAGPPKAQEFPIILQQSVTAGKTPVGTKIQAKL